MEIIYKQDGRYSEYEDLLLERDRYRKEAELYLKEYIRIFGDLITAVFKQKIVCIERKKMLSYCMMYFNRGESVDLKEMQVKINQEMNEYQKQLDAMIENNEICKQMKQIPEIDIIRIKQIYRSIAKKLHPDLNPLTQENEELLELWRRNITAYQCNDLKELEEIEVLVEQALAALGKGKTIISIPDIDDKIKKLYEEIQRIKTTDPYMYKYLLEAPVMVNEKKHQLDDELKEYKDYAAQLDDELKRFILNGGTFQWTN